MHPIAREETEGGQLHRVIFSDTPVRSGDMGGLKNNSWVTWKQKYSSLGRFQQSVFHSEGRCEGHSHSSCSGQTRQARKNTGEVKDGEKGQMKPTDHLQRPPRSSCFGQTWLKYLDIFFGWWSSFRNLCDSFLFLKKKNNKINKRQIHFYVLCH